MKPPHHTTEQEAGPSPQQIASWALALSHWQQRLAPYFARPEPRQHAWLYLRAILSEIPRKNGWQIAEYARQPRPYGMQRLLSQAVWDEAGVRDELRACVQQTLHPPSIGPGQAEPEALFPVLVIDESGFPNGAATRPASRGSIAGPAGASTIARWASFSPT